MTFHLVHQISDTVWIPLGYCSLHKDHLRRKRRGEWRRSFRQASLTKLDYIHPFAQITLRDKELMYRRASKTGGMVGVPIGVITYHRCGSSLGTTISSRQTDRYLRVRRALFRDLHCPR